MTMTTMGILSTQSDKYFQANCQKCDVPLVVPVGEKNEWDYYLCQTCAFAKLGMQWHCCYVNAATVSLMNPKQQPERNETMKIGAYSVTKKNLNHKHFWDCTDIPGIFMCICGATRHYLATTESYCIHEVEE